MSGQVNGNAPRPGVQIAYAVQGPTIIGAGPPVGVVMVQVGDGRCVMGTDKARELALGIIDSACRADLAAAGQQGPRPAVMALNGLPV